MDGQIHPMTKKSRRNKIMELQQIISKEKLREKIGNEYFAHIDGITEDGKYYEARTYMDVLDADGICWIKNDKKYKVGDFVTCKVIDVLDYDLIAEIKK